MMRTYRLSPSTLSLFEECPRCFWLHFNANVKRPSTMFPSLPSGMDKILKEYFDTFLDKGQTPPEVSPLKGATLFQDKELLEKWQNPRQGIRYKDAQGNIIMGAVDYMLERNGKLIVLDFKTKGSAPKETIRAQYKLQLSIYALLFELNKYEVEKFAYLLFYYPEKVQTQDKILFNTRLMEIKADTKKAQDTIHQAIKTLNGNMPEASESCGFCKWGREYHQRFAQKRMSDY